MAERAYRSRRDGRGLVTLVDIITVDFETFYSQDFSLSKLTTEEYVRSPLFETIGVSVKVNAGPVQWCTGDSLAIFSFLRNERFRWGNAVVVAHNAMFDMAILNWHYDIRPKRMADTLSMARALYGSEVGMSLKALTEHFGLGAKGDEVIHAMGKRRRDFAEEELTRYGRYCCNDTELTYALFNKLLEGFPLNELKLIDKTIRMFTEPVLELDAGVLIPHLTSVREKKRLLMDSIEQSKDEIMSNPKLAAVLEGLGVQPPMKPSPTTGKETYAFAKSDEGFKDLLEHPDLRVQTLVAARLGMKSTLEETRTERFISMAARGTLPVPLRYYAAHTGRWGGSDKLNLQNLPRTSPIKKAIRAPDGYVFIDGDSSQIEARTLAWLAEQEDLVAAFSAGEDVYKIMASSIYGKPVEAIAKDERFIGKTVVLGAGYSLGGSRFKLHMKAAGVDISTNDASYIITTYRETYPKIPELWAQGAAALEAMIDDKTAPFGRDGVLLVEGKKGIRLPNGFYLTFPNLRKQENDEGRMEYVYDNKRGKSVVTKRIFGGALVENVCQALARIVVGEQLLMVDKLYNVVMTVHDSIGCVVPEDQESEALEYVQACMRRRPTWAPELPLDCEAGSGASYGDC